MKTLDEVIKGFECCENTDCDNCPYKILFNDDSHVPCNQFSKDEDALYYLREWKSYQGHMEVVDQIHKDAVRQRDLHIKALADLKKKEYELSAMFDEYQAKVAEDPNEPLDWEELCKMGDKAVWIEVHGAKALHTSGWALVGNTSFTTWAGVPSCSLVKVGVTYALPIDEYGKTWQAYRKEVDISEES